MPPRADAREVNAFAEQLREELLVEAEAEGGEVTLEEALTRRVIDTLIEEGAIEEGVPSYYENASRSIMVSGYGIEDEGTLNLLVTLHHNEVPPRSVPPRVAETALQRPLRLWFACRDGTYHERLEPSSDAWGMARDIHLAQRDIDRIRLILITDGLAAAGSEYYEPVIEDGVEIRREVWDVGRLARLELSGQRGDPIEIDFVASFGEPLPCLPAPDVSGDYRAYLAVFPGETLGAIYHEYGARLLELNVRSFLQAVGKVNRGIRDTIANDPGRFLAYNNGISATASSIEIERGADGVMGIARLRDLQIVNGGQTTASIHRAWRDPKVSLEAVAVQAKITELDGERLEEIVPLISRYANSQNKVSEADLRSNDPFHVEIEALSRSIWAPATAGTQRQTKWFYERARGQYADALNRESTAARRRTFRELHPTRQKFTKTDLAKFENTWHQRPHEVSRGAQKNFAGFMLALGEEHRSPDADYFRRLIAKAILFRSTERIVRRKEFGGYRANIVTYAVAKLSHATAQTVDLDAIWQHQALDDAIEDALGELADLAFEVLTDSARPTANVTEWAKREQCWRRMRETNWTVPGGLQSGLRARRARRGEPAANGGGAPDNGLSQLTQDMRAVPAEYWLALANWAKETDNLTGWQRKFAYDWGVQSARGSVPTERQATQLERILRVAEHVGFIRPTD
jgi:hypothetical protein